MEMHIQEVDNRDSKTTTLHLKPVSIDIDPQDMMLNMIQNLPVPLDERYEPIFLALCRCIEADLDLDTELDNQIHYDGLIQIVTDTLKK